MKCIKIITDSDINLKSQNFCNPRIRLGARGIVFNNDGNIAIINKKKKNEYKLVGGGIENNETPTTAFKREVLEETGATIDNISFIGTIEEHKSLDNFKQISYIFTATVKSIKNPSFTKEEIDDDATLLWLPINEAIDKIKSCENNLVASKHEGSMSVYHTKFIVKRDYYILKYYIDNHLREKPKKHIK